MKELPEGLRVIREKLEQSRARYLTMKDGEQVDEALKRCCEAHPKGCGNKMKCKRGNDRLAGLLPPISYSPGEYIRPSKTERFGSWLPQLHLPGAELPVYRG